MAAVMDVVFPSTSSSSLSVTPFLSRFPPKRGSSHLRTPLTKFLPSISKPEKRFHCEPKEKFVIVPASCDAETITDDNSSSLSTSSSSKLQSHIISVSAGKEGPLSSAHLSNSVPDGSHLQIAYKGVRGAYSESAAKKAYPNPEAVPCENFDTAFEAVERWLVDRAVLPIENSLSGSIYRNYDLLLRHRLHIVGEVKFAVRQCLLTNHGVKVEDLKRVLDHPQALIQCENTLAQLGLGREAVDDAAGAAKVLDKQLAYSGQSVALLNKNHLGIQPCKFQTDEREMALVFEENRPSVVVISHSDISDGRETHGAGFLWDKYGHIVTNFHVIHGASDIKVRLLDGSIYFAKVVGSDQDNDLAVLHIDAPNHILRPVDVGISTNLFVGQTVHAIGHPFGLFPFTCTTGVISAFREVGTASGGSIQGIIQVDASINHGNSGGPLLDSSGKLIGVNTFIPRSGYSGIGFALPISTVKGIVDSLLNGIVDSLKVPN